MINKPLQYDLGNIKEWHGKDLEFHIDLCYFQPPSDFFRYNKHCIPHRYQNLYSVCLRQVKDLQSALPRRNPTPSIPGGGGEIELRRNGLLIGGMFSLLQIHSLCNRVILVNIHEM